MSLPSQTSFECDRLHCNDTIGRCAECPQNRREWVGSAGESLATVNVELHWPTREAWSHCRSYPVALVGGKTLKRADVRELHALLTRALERMDAVIESNVLPWEARDAA